MSIVVPTLNEAENLGHVVRRIDRALRLIPHEIVVVDDASTDGTREIADEIASRRPEAIRVVHRSAAKRGLSSAILAGFDAARGEAVAVIDADLQHDPAVLPALLDALGEHEIAIGSRYTFAGRTCGWSFVREATSRAAAALTRAALGISVLDPLSGCFALRRATFDVIRRDLEPRGWKLLVDILASGGERSVAEVPMTFRARIRGKTKMSAAVVRSWLGQLRALRRARSLQPSVLIGARP